MFHAELHVVGAKHAFVAFPLRCQALGIFVAGLDACAVGVGVVLGVSECHVVPIVEGLRDQVRDEIVEEFFECERFLVIVSTCLFTLVVNILGLGYAQSCLSASPRNHPSAPLGAA